MTRRPVLPGAAELFRRTDAAAPQPAPVTELSTLAAAQASPALRSPAATPRRTASVPGVEEAMPGLTLVPAGADASPVAATDARVGGDAR